MREIDAAALATAHHADDQWETVMIRLARGSGISGLAGISPDHDLLGGRLIRPLLHVPKSALIDYCRRRGQDFFDDPSNADPRFARSAWRELSSPLHRLGLTRERAAKLSERAEKCERGLDWAATRLLLDVEILSEENIYDLSGAEDTPQAVVEHFLQSALAKAIGRRASRLERLEKLAGKLGCALRAGDELHTTIGGCTLNLDKSKRLRLRPEPERKRGR
jgi:tRNA(Ile)-lysidine synthase